MMVGIKQEEEEEKKEKNCSSLEGPRCKMLK
jgi:hypothetical protein